MISGWLLQKFIKYLWGKVRVRMLEKLVARIAEETLRRLSPEMRALIVQKVDELETAAAKTPNPWDDIAVMILKCALGIA